MTAHAASRLAQVAVQLQLVGLVQGVGMRPFVSRLARNHGLSGFVCNNTRGVEVHIEGASDSIRAFLDRLREGFPNSACVNQVLSCDAVVAGCNGFTIRQTSMGPATSTRVPVDVCMCDVCRDEVLNFDNRRFHYPFTNCTTCGPRYSLIKSLPFDRERTAMQRFTQCADCLIEYGDADDRRFHSQTNACSKCGPEVSFYDSHFTFEHFGRDAIREAAEAIQNGRIVALQGIGGYQLVCDATSDVAVERLRKRKQRPQKPLAVMVFDIDAAEAIVDLHHPEIAAVTSPENPIVVMERRASSVENRSGGTEQNTAIDAPPFRSSSNHQRDRKISRLVSPGLSHLGIMLPTSPLHLLLLQLAGVPCVVTSGNRDNEPLAFHRESAEASLNDIADVWLHHNRRIVRPVDDSVVRLINHRRVTIRAGRGMTPMPLSIKSRIPILAVGGQQKVAVAISTKDQSVLGPHLGDMQSIAARERFMESVKSLCELYNVTPAVIVHDAHPDYFTTQWARQQGKRTIAVQHHHAHVVAGMLEHGWLDREVLGVAFDGTGYGTDNTIWGGEFLLSTASRFRRVARLRPFPLVGGERAVQQPWRLAMALLHDADADHSGLYCPNATQRAHVLKVLQQRALTTENRLCQITSSMGRLFDAVASLLLGIGEVSYEGEAAMRLEAVCDPDVDGHYDLPVYDGELTELDWRPMVRQIVADLKHNTPTGTVAMRFVRGIAIGVQQICRRFPEYPVVLSGGCFQNAVLTQQIAEALSTHAAAIGFPGMIPPNDGGLAAGQLVIAAAILEDSASTEGAD